MSRFGNLNKQLNALDIHEKANEFASLQSSHTQAGEFIQLVLAIFSDYYTEIVKPRTHLTLAVQKKEPTLEQLRLATRPSLYIYNVNLVLPAEQWVRKLKSNESDDFAKSGELPSLSWHPNIAAQLRLELHDQYSVDTKEYANILQPTITFRVWGNITSAKDMLLVSQSAAGTFFTSGEHIKIMTNIDGGWDQSASIITITLNDKNIVDIEKILTAGLSLITTNVVQYPAL